MPDNKETTATVKRRTTTLHTHTLTLEEWGRSSKNSQEKTVNENNFAISGSADTVSKFNAEKRSKQIAQRKPNRRNGNINKEAIIKQHMKTETMKILFVVYCAAAAQLCVCVSV